MSYIEFASQQPTSYGHTHRKSIRTARNETHNQMQIKKKIVGQKPRRRLPHRLNVLSTQCKGNPGGPRYLKSPGRGNPKVNWNARTECCHAYGWSSTAPGKCSSHVGFISLLNSIASPSRPPTSTIKVCDSLVHAFVNPFNGFGFEDPDAYEIARDPHADEPDSDGDADNQGSDEEGNNHAVNIDRVYMLSTLMWIILYRDPTSPSILGSLFEHSALQELLNRVFYNDQGNSEAALAFFANALLCVITEYQTGERVKSRMSAKIWQPSYEKLLRAIQDFAANDI
ncbi:hypothetical protein B0H13DRAFT_2301146 [Mycena leptocephala]|nr:hypothetical protein B0H13DRAFT_2301146 [Mycena leptocephala]